MYKEGVSSSLNVTGYGLLMFSTLSGCRNATALSALFPPRLLRGAWLEGHKYRAAGKANPLPQG